jgi:hypothetical protein
MFDPIWEDLFDDLEVPVIIGLLPADYCVVCFHPKHNNPCDHEDEAVHDPDMWDFPEMALPYSVHVPCGCFEYVSEEDRGNKQVVVEDFGYIDAG